MGHTNSTANLSLPQFIGTDKPTWLGDVNGAFLAIDGYAGTNDAAVAAAASDASSALSQASAAVNTANTANTTAGNASTAANNAVGVANTANAIAGTVDAKVGLLADLNTTDRTSIVNAINEVLDDIPGHGASVSVSSDGIKTNEQLFDSLYTAIDSSKISETSILVADIGTVKKVYPITRIASSDYAFGNVGAGAAAFYRVASSASTYSEFAFYTGTYTDYASTVPTAGETYTVIY